MVTIWRWQPLLPLGKSIHRGQNRGSDQSLRDGYPQPPPSPTPRRKRCQNRGSDRSLRAGKTVTTRWPSFAGSISSEEKISLSRHLLNPFNLKKINLLRAFWSMTCDQYQSIKLVFTAIGLKDDIILQARGNVQVLWLNMHLSQNTPSSWFVDLVVVDKLFFRKVHWQKWQWPSISRRQQHRLHFAARKLAK